MDDTNESLQGLDAGTTGDCLLSLVARDNIVIKVKKELMIKESGFIAAALEDDKEASTIACCMVEASVLQAIVGFVQHHYGGPQEVRCGVMESVRVEERDLAAECRSKRYSYASTPLPNDTGLYPLLDEFDKQLLQHDSKGEREHQLWITKVLLAANYLEVPELILLAAAAMTEIFNQCEGDPYEAYHNMAKPDEEEEKEIFRKYGSKDNKTYGNLFDDPKIISKEG